MLVAPTAHVELPVHRLVAALEPTDGHALPLRVISLLHRRGVLVMDLHLSSTGRRPGEDRPDQVVILFRSTDQHAHVVRAGFDSMAFITNASLELNVLSGVHGDPGTT